MKLASMTVESCRIDKKSVELLGGNAGEKNAYLMTE